MLGWRLLFAHHFYAEAWTASGDRSRRRPKEILGQVTRSTSTNWGSTLPLFAFQKKNVLCVPCYLTCTNFLRPLMLMIAVRCIHKGGFFFPHSMQMMPTLEVAWSSEQGSLFKDPRILLSIQQVSWYHQAFSKVLQVARVAKQLVLFSLPNTFLALWIYFTEHHLLVLRTRSLFVSSIETLVIDSPWAEVERERSKQVNTKINVRIWKYDE
jgi:hypothetical protein